MASWTPIPHDQELARSFRLSLAHTKEVTFQFPPKITNDSRKGEWYEKRIPGTEPVATLAKPDAHTYNITWTYIVVDDRDTGGPWTASKIHSELTALRGYWMYGPDDDLVVSVHFWNIGGPKPATGRITEVDVKYGDTIVGNGDEAFPLRTDVSITLKLWAQMGDKHGTEKAAVTALARGTSTAVEDDIVQKIQKLDRTIDPTWY